MTSKFSRMYKQTLVKGCNLLLRNFLQLFIALTERTLWQSTGKNSGKTGSPRQRIWEGDGQFSICVRLCIYEWRRSLHGFSLVSVIIKVYVVVALRWKIFQEIFNHLERFLIVTGKLIMLPKHRHHPKYFHQLLLVSTIWWWLYTITVLSLHKQCIRLSRQWSGYLNSSVILSWLPVNYFCNWCLTNIRH